MFFLAFLICNLLIPKSYASIGKCSPEEDYICSGSCVNYPLQTKLTEGVAVCMKDIKTNACVCWMHSEASSLENLFFCEAKINGTVSQILCHVPTHCFPPGPEISCLVVTNCNCVEMSDGDISIPSTSHFMWKPIRAIVKFSSHSEKYPDHVREFSLKHLLFLLGFVIAPLLCWCLLNFYNEGKCRRKQVTTEETLAVTSEERNSDESDHQEDERSTRHNSRSSNNNEITTHNQPVVFVTGGIAEAGVAVCSVVSTSTRSKTECPPTYDEAVSNNLLQEEGGPPPSYEDAVEGRDSCVRQMWQTVYVIHSGRCENV